MDNLLILEKNAIKAFMNQKRKRHDEYQNQGKGNDYGIRRKK